MQQNSVALSDNHANILAFIQDVWSVGTEG